ncbi:MAG: helix-turn-helix domain-containing protein [Kofleriaceae bacterium]
MPRKVQPETPLYVKLPQSAVDKLDRAAEELGLPKKEIVAGLVTKYLEPLSSPSATTAGYSFRSYDPPDLPEVMNAEQAGQFLQIDERNVIELAEAGKLPGRKLGPVWRFSREAILAWLATPDETRDSKEKKR